MAENLKAYGIECAVYHAGLPSEKRAEVQTQFMESDRGVVCATIAFGMGIDKCECFVPFLLDNILNIRT